jgi:protein-S-isoprenylcysteine O-methyltransferase Ste14
MWLAARLLPQLDLDLPLRYALAGSVGAVGLIVVLLAVVPFRHSRTTLDPRYPERASTLVTDGIYAVSRNPMYVAMLFGLVAWGLYLDNAAGLAVAPPCFVLYLNRRQIEPEERALAAAFGEDYERYRRRVRRWF